MKLKFEKNKIEEITVTIDGNNFVSQNYIEMIKQLYLGTKMQFEFGEDITQEEQNSVIKMVGMINNIDTKNSKNTTEEVRNEDDINPEDIPF